MEIVYGLLVVTHLVGMAAVVGGWMVAQQAPKILRPMVDGAYAQILTGVLLVGLAESGTADVDLDNTKVAVKLLVGLAVAVLVFRHRRKESVSRVVLNAVGGLALVNVVIGVLW